MLVTQFFATPVFETPVFESLTGLSLLSPAFMVLLLLLPLAYFLRRRGQPGIAFSSYPLLEQARVKKTLRQSCLIILPVLQVLTLVLVVLALARPTLRVPLPREKAGIDIFLCLDLSSSMAAKDLDPEKSRLELAKDAAHKFVQAQLDDRIGLVQFARYPDLLCPLTLDHETLGEYLRSMTIVESDGQEDLTGIGTAVARAAQVLQDSIAQSKVIILLTDGEENVATKAKPEEIGPLRAALLCKELGIRVYTIAVGVGKQDKSGKFIPLDNSQMKELAGLTGGAFFAAPEAEALSKVYEKISLLEKHEFEEARFEDREQFLPFLLLALLLLGLRLFLQAVSLEVLP